MRVASVLFTLFNFQYPYPTAMTGNIPLTEFPLFPNLPQDLRLSVWDAFMDLQDSRLVELELDVRNGVPGAQIIARCSYPPLLRICRESRRVGLIAYKLCFKTTSLLRPPLRKRWPIWFSGVYFNPAVDILYLPRGPYSRTLFERLFHPRYARDLYDPAFSRQIHFVAMGYFLYQARWEISYFTDMLSGLEGLRRIFFMQSYEPEYAMRGLGSPPEEIRQFFENLHARNHESSLPRVIAMRWEAPGHPIPTARQEVLKEAIVSLEIGVSGP